MFRSKRRADSSTVAAFPSHFLILFLHAVAFLVLTRQVVAEPQTNVTIDDSDPAFVEYAPSQAWHASTVPCSTCLNPPLSDAFKGTWHDGTHIVFTIDADDFPGGSGEEGASSSNADGESTISAPGTSPSAPPTSPAPSPPPSTTTNAPPPATTTKKDDDDGHDDDDDRGNHHDDDDHKRRSIGELARRDVAGNPFFTQGNDSDDEGFEDVPVTATFIFNGTAIYLFAIVPLFPAPANTTPTWMELNFTLDSKPFGKFISQPGSVNGAASNVSASASDSDSSTSPHYASGVPVFQAADLEDKQHNLVVNVGVDTVFLFDYAIITQSKADAADHLGANADIEA